MAVCPAKEVKKNRLRKLATCYIKAGSILKKNIKISSKLLLLVSFKLFCIRDYMIVKGYLHSSDCSRLLRSGELRWPLGLRLGESYSEIILVLIEDR